MQIFTLCEGLARRIIADRLAVASGTLSANTANYFTVHSLHSPFVYYLLLPFYYPFTTLFTSQNTRFPPVDSKWNKRVVKVVISKFMRYFRIVIGFTTLTTLTTFYYPTTITTFFTSKPSLVTLVLCRKSVLSLHRLLQFPEAFRYTGPTVLSQCWRIAG